MPHNYIYYNGYGVVMCDTSKYRDILDFLRYNTAMLASVSIFLIGSVLYYLVI